MKSARRSILLCLICGSLPLTIACGSNDMSGLFSPSGGDAPISTGGSLGGGASNGGQSAGGHAGSSASNAGASGSSSSAGQGTSGGNTSGGNAGASGSGAGGMNAGGSAGASSGGANASGGAGTGGSVGGTVGAGGAGAGTGGDTAGGSGGSAGIGGVSGSAGSGGTATGCPLNGKPPQDGSMCTLLTPDNCFYPGEACSCLSNGTLTRHWSCYGTPDKCPTASDVQPTDGASCKGFNGGLCPYAADDYCVCTPALIGGAEPKWACAAASPNCPDMRPGSTPCGGNVRECGYADRECFCEGGGSWVCQ